MNKYNIYGMDGAFLSGAGRGSTHAEALVELRASSFAYAEALVLGREYIVVDHERRGAQSVRVVRLDEPDPTPPVVATVRTAR